MIWLWILIYYAVLSVLAVFIKTPYLTQVGITYARWALFLVSAILILITRPVLPLVRDIKKRKLQRNFAWLLLSPSILIPLASYIFAFFAGTAKEFWAFLILGGFHLFRFYGQLEKML